jgi:hypothetical protein
MRTRFGINYCAVLLALTALGIAPVARGAETYRGRCDVTFSGDSTLHDFVGHITNLPVVVRLETNSANLATVSTRLEIKPRQLSTHHKGRDASMYKMFREDRFPTLAVTVSNASLVEARLTAESRDARPGKLPLQLSFCGVTNSVSAMTSHPVLLAEGWEFDLDTAVSLKSFNLDPPSAMFGAISVKDTVKIKAHIRVLKEPPKS